MSLAIPAIHRLYEMMKLSTETLAFEFLAVLVALDHRKPPAASPASAMHAAGRRYVPEMNADRAPGPDVEKLLELFGSDEWQRLSHCAGP